MNTAKPRPSLFAHAPGELSQDAFISWLASWADPVFATSDPSLHETGRQFLNHLFEKAGRQPPTSYDSVQVKRQHKNIDVLLVVNLTTAVLIEDKTNTKDHSGQLQRYLDALSEEFSLERIVAVFLKTGDQSSRRRIEEAGYNYFGRSDLLAVLTGGEERGVVDSIFRDFTDNLRRIEKSVQSYRTEPPERWDDDWNRWIGFFTALQSKLPDGEWDYVPNRRGGFMGFWWHWKGHHYLQLEMDKLCFKIQLGDKSSRDSAWRQSHAAVIDQSSASGFPLQRKTRRLGRSMTVAVSKQDYRQTGKDGLLDLEATVKVLHQAETLLDAAVVSMDQTTAPRTETVT